ncbi:MAG: NUDIX domain-containing protein [Flavobacteriales bacterium]|nr:NUDIX domain-containing protein [Flavobacteriales bacterium]
MEENSVGINRFNVRVYMILEHEGSILLSDEFILGKAYTKFPGGGLEYGEGLIEGLKREAIEELGQEIEVLEHFYTTDFFQRSGFRESDQLIAVYYSARLKTAPKFKVSEKRFDFDTSKLDTEVFRWVALSELHPEMMSFPIDKHVVSQLKGI